MAGCIAFDDGNVVALSTTQIFFIDYLLRPYLEKLNLAKNIFFHYDLYDGPIKFYEMTTEQYMQCYRVLKQAFEQDLRSDPIRNGRSCLWAVDLWLEEIKPTMKSGTLFCPELSGDDTPYEDHQAS